MDDIVNRILIVPGLNNSGAGHWQTEWEQRLPEAKRIQLDDWSTPNLAAWVDAIEYAIETFAPTHLVAHSFGALASAVIAEKYTDRLRGLFLVAPADPDKFGIRHLLQTAALPVAGMLLGSLSDPWLSWDGARALGQQWGLRVKCAGDVGHINVQSGHGNWPEGWRELQEFLRQTSAMATPPEQRLRCAS